MAEDKRKNNGGHKTNGGRKSKAEELQANNIFLLAIKAVNNVNNDEDARTSFAKDLLTFERGKMFIAEHLFGKPKETIDTNHNLNNFDIKELFKFDNNKE